MNKQKWVKIMRDIGLDDVTMTKLHHEFEDQYPNEHQSFLEWLNISSDEIKIIRAM